MSVATTRDEILALEKRRCAALTSGNVAALRELMADDLVHVHGNGVMDDKDGYLKGVETKYVFHRVERGDLNVRVYADVAVVVGPLEQTVSVRGVDKLNQIKAIATQTWVRSGAGWKQSTCHNAFLSVA
ncbi:nuclear transport factor 2 family protein [Pseudolabrys taiwanensis]|uniref:Nuclear transport factor 2 family protein n=1 Tax=Pseudolabrys taiwanensis TaxID=331696 RepID=A0A345ZWV6_9HYPH|nr:nuclear transport factor 2 family protein [Pseudolabrys taiwanensis]AXK81403.1 nuclear transport factor 2 family protein [Pseudolabrys taiwanensis]